MYEIMQVGGTKTEKPSLVIKKTDEDGKEFWIPFNESNTDYQQYLIDTDGGLPIPEETVE